MLSYDGPVHFARVGENNVAIDQLRKHQLMDGRRGRMNPLQLLRGRNLLGTDRPCDDDLGIDNLFVHTRIIGKSYQADLVKLLLEALRKPIRRVPLIERMMNEDQKLHG